MGLALVPNPLDQSPSDKYESCLNELIDFCEEYWGAFDIKALRIVLAAAYAHQFTSERVPWLWVNSAPRKFPQALGNALGRVLHAPAAGIVAKDLKAQTDREKSLWVLEGQEGIFHRTPAEIEFCLRQLAAIEAGEFEWHSRGIAVDGRQGPADSFVWTGRITVIACTNRPLDKLQAERCRPLWPIVQNSFVNVRFSKMGERQDLYEKWKDADEWVCRKLQRMISNLMDVDFREQDRRTKQLSDSFGQLTFMAQVVAALRGPGFDAESLLSKANQIATAHASMMGKQRSDAEDLVLARKVLLDAIPPSAIQVLKAMPLEGYWTLKQLQTLSRCPPLAVRRVAEQLSQTGSLLFEDGQKMRGKGRRKYPTLPDHYAVSPELGRALMGGFGS